MHTETEHQDVTPTESVVPVYLVPLTDEEIRVRTEAESFEQQRLAAEVQLAATRTAGIAKLVALGLTEQEALALITG